MRCISVIAVRNGIDYVEKCIRHLIDNEIEVAIIDQSSDDGTYEVCEVFKNDGLCALKRIDYPGYFSLHDQLIEKYKLIDEIKSDWVIHQDIDECLECPVPGLNLKESIRQEDEKGFNVINFNEFVFLPYEQYSSFYQSPYYYFFSPFAPRLMRAWNKKTNLTALDSGGHLLKGAVNISPLNHLLRHYIFTSQEHAFEKYENRKFSYNEIDRGWHKNRIFIPRDRLIFPEKEFLNELDFSKHSEFDTSNPWCKHYWES